MSLATMLWLFIITGFLGGIISATHDNLFSVSGDKGSIRVQLRKTYPNRSILYFIGRGLIGIGGAFGVVFFGCLIGKIKTEATVDNQLVLVCLGVVSGIISSKYLPTISDRLERQFLSNEISETKKQAIEMSNSVMDYAASISFAESALSRDGYSADTDLAIERLEAIKSKFAKDRTLHIFLGRLYRKKGDLKKAILALREFIAATCDRGGKSPTVASQQACAAAFFNIACYHVLMAAEAEAASKGDTEVNRLIREATDSLKLSIENWPQAKDYAKKDPDFKFIENDPIYKDLTDS